jgi:phosphate transport system ATP-binding protein
LKKTKTKVRVKNLNVMMLPFERKSPDFKENSGVNLEGSEKSKSYNSSFSVYSYESVGITESEEKSEGNKKEEQSKKNEDLKVKIEVNRLSFYYGKEKVLKNISLNIYANKITAIMGPSGCGKTTFLRCMNRMHDLYMNTKYEGEIIIHPDRINIISKNIDVVKVRMRFGMVFQKPNPFPKSIYENVAYGLRIKGIKSKSELDERVEKALKIAALCDEVKDRLDQNAYILSGGQQQRLCIARAIAPEPDVLLLDEPTSALDPVSTAKIEELLGELKNVITIMIVTHSTQQAARVSDFTAFFYYGELIEYDRTQKIFVNPSSKITEKYISGTFG